MKGIIFANAKLKEVGAKMKRINMTGLIEKYSEKYRKAGKKEKSRILDEFIELTEYNRSYASLILRRGYSKKNKRSKFTKRRGRKKKYDFEVLRKLKDGSAGGPCRSGQTATVRPKAYVSVLLKSTLA